jgi:hypothetical protein
MAELVRKLREDRKTNPTSPPSRPILIHNFSELTTVEQVKTVIQRELVNVLGAEVQPASSNEVWYHSTEFDHFILARRGSEAGDYYNDRTISLLRSQLKRRRNFPVDTVLVDIQLAAQELLQKYLAEDNGESLTHNTIIRKIVLAASQAPGDERKLKLDGKIELKQEVPSGNRSSYHSLTHYYNSCT